MEQVASLPWVSFSFIPGLVGLVLIAVGVLILTMSRPLVFPTRWLLLPFVGCFLAEELRWVVTRPGDASGALGWLFVVNWLFVATTGAAGVLIWVLSRSYLVWGVGEDDLDASLRDALTSLNQPFEQLLTGFKLTGVGADLNVQTQDGSTWRLHVRPRGQNRLLKAVAERLRGYYASRTVPVNHRGARFFLASGLVFMLFQACEVVTTLPH